MPSDLNPEISPAFSPLSLARMLWKSKLLICAVWIAVSIGAYLVVKRIPGRYRAEAVILVDTQKIPDKYVASTVVSDAQDRLASISQEILSSGRLQKIIDDFDLYHAQRGKRFMEEILAMMRQDVEITPERNWNGRTASFRISYQGPDPAVVAQVTNKIASLYVEENLKARETQAEGTTEFINNQLKEAKQSLDQLEAAVSQYKVKHNGELPQQEGSLNGILSRLGIQLEANRDAVNRAQQQKVMEQQSLNLAQDTESTQLRELRAAAAASLAPPAPAGLPFTAASEPKPRKRSEELESQLADLRLRYGDSHPDVRRLQILIAQAKQQEAKSFQPAESHVPAAAGAGSGPSKPPAPVTSPELIQTRARIASLKSQLEATERDLETRQAEQQRILSDIAAYQTKVGGLPIREQEMEALTRDYEISKANYRSLLDKKIAAEMASDMERREKSERFTIVDPARVPSKPFKPNRMALALGGSVFGLVLGVVLGLGKEFQKAVFLGEWELPEGLLILGRLPYIETAGVASARGGGRAVPPKRPGWKLAILSSALLSVLGAAGIYLFSRKF